MSLVELELGSLLVYQLFFEEKNYIQKLIQSSNQGDTTTLSECPASAVHYAHSQHNQKEENANTV